jgi:hypothetical protein
MIVKENIHDSKRKHKKIVSELKKNALMCIPLVKICLIALLVNPARIETVG